MDITQNVLYRSAIALRHTFIVGKIGLSYIYFMFSCFFLAIVYLKV